MEIGVKIICPLLTSNSHHLLSAYDIPGSMPRTSSHQCSTRPSKHTHKLDTRFSGLQKKKKEWVTETPQYPSQISQLVNGAASPTGLNWLQSQALKPTGLWAQQTVDLVQRWGGCCFPFSLGLYGSSVGSRVFLERAHIGLQEKAQLLKCLPHNSEDHISNPQNPCLMPESIILGRREGWEARNGESLESGLQIAWLMWRSPT